MSKPKLHVRKDDKVKVISGKDRGKEGKILKVFPQEGRVIVKGVSIIKKHMKPSQDNPEGGIIEKEAPIDASNVMLICNNCGAPSRTGKKILDNGDKVRFCKKCEKDID